MNARLEQLVAERTQELVTSEERFRDLVEMLPEAVFETDLDLNLTFANQHAFELFGYSEGDLRQGLNGLEMFTPEERNCIKANFAKRQKGEPVGIVEYQALKKDGTTFPVILHANSIMKEDRLIGLRGVIIDITLRKQAEDELRLNEEKYRALYDNAPLSYQSLDEDGCFLDVNPAWLKTLGYSREEVIGSKYEDFLHPDSKSHFEKNFPEFKKRGYVHDVQFRIRHKDGHFLDISFEGCIGYLPDGSFRQTYCVFQDITERKEAEESLRRSENRFWQIADNSPAWIWEVDSNGMYTFCSKAGEDILGFKVEEIVGKKYFYDFFHSEDREELKNFVLEAFKQKQPIQRFSNRNVTRSGEIVWLLTNGVPMLDPDGNLLGYRGADINITELQEANKEKLRLEENYHQAQKVESIGRLAGGVAHDLNNLLTPILGYSEMLLDDLDPDSTEWRHMNEIISAGNRIRDLVRQLLAFGRKQTLVYRQVALDKVLTGFEKLLRRTIREDIKIEIILSPDIRTVMADIGQIEQVIMNLAVNAQDAMPKGGHLTIETSPVELDEEYAVTHQGVKPGAYVMLAISDTGCGMDDEILEHIFEPFFSTKGELGTGLGLATVYGIVKQHEGNIWVYSELGMGTTFKIYLPVSGEAHVEKETKEKISADLKGSETILLVEDNEQVRNLAFAILERQGYTVLTAESGSIILTILATNNRPVDLLLTDVIMPGMNGRDLFVKVSEQHPGIKILYMSGYTDNTIANHGVLDEGVHFIQKPFSAQSLAAKVREVLDRGN